MPMLRTSAKKALFGPLEAVPAGLAIRLLSRRLHEPFQRYLIQAKRPGRAGSFLAERLLLDVAGGPDLPPVLIGGPARIGKSTLARCLAARFGYHVVNTDQFERYLQPVWGEKDVWRFKRACVSRLLDEASVPVIVEGTHLVTHGRCAHQAEVRISLAWMDALHRNTGAVHLAVGSTGKRIEKLRAIESRLSSCWTRTRSRRERWALVRRMTFISGEVRREASLWGVPYRELGAGSFASDLETAFSQLEARVRNGW